MIDENGPVLFLITGHTGAGKSTIAKQMAHEHAAFYLSHDELLVKAYGDNINQLDFGDCCDRMDRLIWRQALQLFDLGVNLVVEGYGTKTMREGVKQQAAKIGYRFQIVWVDCPPDIRLARVLKRNEQLNDEGYYIDESSFYRMEEANDSLISSEVDFWIDNSINK